MIYILEDNEDRIRQFRAAVAAIAPNLPVRFWRSAHAMIAELVDGLQHATLISLDHDLNREPDEPDPGTGYDWTSPQIVGAPNEGHNGFRRSVSDERASNEEEF